MKTDNSKNLNMHTLLSMVTAVIGVMLLIYMIFVEDEPGAIPLLLIIVGAGWHFISRYKIRLRGGSE